MNLRSFVASILLTALVFVTTGNCQPKRMSPELLWKLGRLGSATVSPNEKMIAYTVRNYDLKQNAGRSTIHLKLLEQGTTVTPVSNWKVVGALDWIKINGEDQLVFEGMRGDEAAPAVQAWMLRLSDLKLTQMTDYAEGISNLKVSPTGKHIAFTMDIKMDSTVNELYKDLPKADARIIDSLMYRHWNQWHDYKYSHLHVAAIDKEGKAGKATDLMPGIKADCPVPPFNGSENFNWSPDGKELAYTVKIDKKWAETTNSDVYVVPATGGKAKNISAGRMGYDNNPVYSPDGKTIAFSSMPRAGFEADRNHIMVYDRSSGSVKDATESLDQTTHGKHFLPGGGFAYSAEHKGTNQIFAVGSKFGAGESEEFGKQLSKGRYNFSLEQVFDGGKKGLVSYMSMLRPRELGILDFSTNELTPVSDINGEIYKTLQLPTIKERWVTATDGKKIHCWVIYPPNFSPEKKWPMLLYCQGGPQGQIGQWFSFRWNFHLMASHGGYVIVAPNRRGLPGFGQAWNDEISGDWGGQAMRDLLSATDDMAKESYIDKKKIGAIGASFGGYTVYWLMGNAAEKFACMIAHCGVFNLESMYGSTEELFFVNWDLGGPYWKGGDVQKEYNQFSPHRFVKNWKTPLFVIHGEKDFRVPITQGMEAFTAAQVNGVPSRFLYFPNEGHWVLGPQNGVLWHRLFFDWLQRYLK